MEEDIVTNMKPRKTNTTKKKWLNKRIIAIFLGTVLSVVFFFWIMHMNDAYLSVLKEVKKDHQQLTRQILSAKQELAGIPSFDISVPEQRLARSKELLARELNRIPGALNINDLIGTILETAEDCQVKALPLTTTPPEASVINKYEYSHWHITLSATGKFKNFAKFIDNLDGKYIPTASVASIAVKLSDEDMKNSTIEDNTVLVTGTIELVVYTRPYDNKEKAQ